MMILIEQLPVYIEIIILQIIPVEIAKTEFHKTVLVLNIVESGSFNINQTGFKLIRNQHMIRTKLSVNISITASGFYFGLKVVQHIEQLTLIPADNINIFRGI